MSRMEKVEQLSINPFADEPLQKAFYYPTKIKDWNDAEKQKSKLQTKSETEEELKQTIKESRKFLQATNTYSSRLLTVKDAIPVGNMSELFEESWPATDKPSSLSGFSFDAPATKTERSRKEYEWDRYDRQMKPERDVSTAPPNHKPESTLAKYIERFRHGTPMSREEREKQRASDKADFWWISEQSKISEPSDTSTPKSDSRAVGRTKYKAGVSSRDKATTPNSLNEFMRKEKENEKRGKKHGSGLNDSIWMLQDKADRLLEKSCSSVNSASAIVSTDGLGSAMSTSTQQSLAEAPYRPDFTKKTAELLKRETLKSGEDILEQWRRRRKVDEMKARAASGEPVSKTASVLPRHKHPGISVEMFRHKVQQAINEAQQPRVPALAHRDVSFTPAPAQPRRSTVQCEIAVQTSGDVSPIHTARDTEHLPRDCAHVMSHKHLSCDIIPCPYTVQRDDCAHDRGELTSDSHANKNARVHHHKAIDSHINNEMQSHSPLARHSHSFKGASSHAIMSHDSSSRGALSQAVSSRAMSQGRVSSASICQTVQDHPVDREQTRVKHLEASRHSRQNNKQPDVEPLSSSNNSDASETVKKVSKKAPTKSKQSKSQSTRRMQNESEISDSASEKGTGDVPIVYKQDNKTPISGTQNDFVGSTVADNAQTPVTPPSRSKPPNQGERKVAESFDTYKSWQDSMVGASIDSLTDVTDANISYSFSHMQEKRLDKSPKTVTTQEMCNTRDQDLAVDKSKLQKADCESRSVDSKQKARKSKQTKKKEETNSKQIQEVSEVVEDEQQESLSGSFSSTVADVVNGHLFPNTVTTLAGSVEDSFQASLTPLELALQARSTQEQFIQHSENDDEDLETALLSDGEEYADDELLRDLRRRRIVHINKLKAIDSLMKSCDHS